MKDPRWHKQKQARTIVQDRRQCWSQMLRARQVRDAIGACRIQSADLPIRSGISTHGSTFSISRRLPRSFYLVHCTEYAFTECEYACTEQGKDLTTEGPSRLLLERTM